MKFGTVERSRTDEKGNTVTTVTNYAKGAILPPVKTKYAERRRVTGKDQEYVTYIEFSDMVHADKRLLDPYVSLEFPKLREVDYYYVVLHYTRFEE